MEIAGTVIRLLRGLECLFILLLGFTMSAYSSKLKHFSMPGETCAYIVDHGDQYQVSSLDLIPTEPAANDNAVAKYVTHYPGNVSCDVAFRTDEDKKFYMRIIEFEVEESPLCVRDGLWLYNGPSATPENLITPHGLCGLTLSLPNYFKSSGHEVTLRFVTDWANNDFNGFTILLTPYHQPEEGESCAGDEWQCTLSGKCLTRDVKCNGVFQCEDGSDEPPSCHLAGNTDEFFTELYSTNSEHHTDAGGGASSLCGFLAMVTSFALVVFFVTDQRSLSAGR